MPIDLRDQLWSDGVLRHRDARFKALTGGVSSEIYRVDDGDESFVVKRALPKLKVKDEWVANVDRNRYERLYIEYVGRIAPGFVPILRATGDGFFAMELLGEGFEPWKARLMRGNARKEDAARAGSFLAAVHAQSAGDAEAQEMFDSTTNFFELRVEPYLLATARRHPEIAAYFHNQAEQLVRTRRCLVHGDFSPKNIMLSSDRMVILDCEVAWYGDPAFDVAFLMTHLLLKGLYHAPQNVGLHELSKAFLASYFQGIAARLDRDEVERHASRLLPMLLLARKDGKSPVEYLDDLGKSDWLRQFVRLKIRQEAVTLQEIYDPWFQSLGQLKAAR